MTLTVRLDETLEAALARHCAATGSSKSHVVQESLAAYLLHGPQPAAVRTGDDSEALSANFRAFAAAGLVGGVALADGVTGGATGAPDGSAVKAVVRAKVASRALARSAKP